MRLYDWARVPLPWTRPDGFERYLLIRRHRRDPDKRAYYLVFCRGGTTLAELAGAAGLRWTIEECFGRAKDDLGLDHCEAILAPLAPPFDARPGRGRFPGAPRGRSPPDNVGLPAAPIAVIRQSERKESKGLGRVTWVVVLLPSTAEIRALLARLVFRPPIRMSFALRWSRWRRTHQAQATQCRYQLHYNMHCNTRRDSALADKRRMGGVLRIEIVILAAPAPVVPVRRRDLQDLDPGRLNEAKQAGPIAVGALDADPLDLAEERHSGSAADGEIGG